MEFQVASILALIHCTQEEIRRRKRTRKKRGIKILKKDSNLLFLETNHYFVNPLIHMETLKRNPKPLRLKVKH